MTKDAPVNDGYSQVLNTSADGCAVALMVVCVSKYCMYALNGR